MARAGAAMLMAIASFACVAGTGTTLRVNPIRRVVNMLDAMTKKITKEGEKEEELFNQFMCYCKNGEDSLAKSISAAENRVPQLESSIKAIAAEVEQLTADVKAAKEGRAEAKAALAEGKALRQKESGAFAKDSGDLKTNIAAVGKALAALEKGSAGGFLQTSSASVLRRISITIDMTPVDRDMLSSFLSVDQNADYAPQGGEIIGILKQMGSTMQASLTDVTAKEKEAQESYDSMAASKEKEVAAMGDEIEDKTARIGKGGVKLVNAKEDLDDTSHALAEDKAFLADLDTNCATKKQEWEARQKLRAQEILAVHETIKILNDDDALDLFKKTLPSPALLQLQSTAKETKQRALQVLAGQLHQRKHDVRINLLAMAIKGKKVSFDKVLSMIDEMVALLGKEQQHDDNKKEFCSSQFDKVEDELKTLQHRIADIGKAIEDTKGSIAQLTEEVAALEAGVKDLDKQVADATAQRKEEHAEYSETLAANNAAVDLLGMAKNRLNKFYDPKLYKAPPKRELSDEDRIAVNMGGTMAPTAPPGGIAGTGVEAFVQLGSEPKTWGSYVQEGPKSTGVIAMLDMLVADLKKDIQEMEVDEKHAQGEYEALLKASATKRADDVKSVADKEAVKADLTSNLQKLKGEGKATKAEEMAKANTLMDLHKECDWLLANFDTRKNAREAEADSLDKAKAVLSGADYSL